MKHRTSDHYVGGAAAFCASTYKTKDAHFCTPFSLFTKVVPEWCSVFAFFHNQKKIYPKGFGGDRKAPETDERKEPVPKD